jgi:hypothetical protein
MMPTEPGPGPETIPAAHAPAEAPPRFKWYHKLSAVVFITFCLEVGFFLLIFPWTDAWDNSYFANLGPDWHIYWGNMYVRGAVSGVGVVNLYISFLEMFRLRRFARR